MDRKLLFLVCMLILLTSLADQSSFSATLNGEVEKGQGLSQNPRPKIALALGGGGIRGAAHIGVLKVLIKEHIPIDYIAGCSMGAIIGGMYSAGVPVDRLQLLVEDNALQHAYAPGHVPTQVCLYGICKLENIFRKQKPYSGFFTGRKFEKFLAQAISPSPTKIEDLKIPFCAVATNLVDGQECWLNSGDLCKAILASSAVPPIIKPVEIDGNLYIDGSLRDNVAVAAARQFHPDLVIAVPVDGGDKLRHIDAHKFTHIRGIAARVEDILLDVADPYHLEDADIIIRPDVADIFVFSRRTTDARAAIAAGEAAAIAALPKIRQAIARWNAARLAETSAHAEVGNTN